MAIKIVEDRLYHHKDAPPDIFMAVAVADDGRMWAHGNALSRTHPRWKPVPLEDWTLVEARPRGTGDYGFWRCHESQNL